MHTPFFNTGKQWGNLDSNPIIWYTIMLALLYLYSISLLKLQNQNILTIFLLVFMD